MNNELQLTDHQERVYRRFYRALVNLPVCFGREVVLLNEEEKELDQAFGDAYALCEEVEDDSVDALSLDHRQIDMLAMLAAADATEQLSSQLLLIEGGEENFND